MESCYTTVAFRLSGDLCLASSSSWFIIIITSFIFIHSFCVLVWVDVKVWCMRVKYKFIRFPLNSYMMTSSRARFIYSGRRGFITNIDHQSHDTLSSNPNCACADGVIICDGKPRAPRLQRWWPLEVAISDLFNESIGLEAAVTLISAEGNGGGSTLSSAVKTKWQSREHGSEFTRTS